jgi:hypothetical protein
MNKTKLMTLKSILDESIERDKKSLDNPLIRDQVVQNMFMSAIIDAILGDEPKK